MYVEFAVVLVGYCKDVALSRLFNQVHLEVVPLKLRGIHLDVRLQIILMQLTQTVIVLLVVAEEC